MKIAILGSAGSVQLAPFKNSDYDNWVQGKVESAARAHGQIPGDFDIWGCSPGCWAVSPRFTRFFEVHRWQPGAPWFSPEYCQFLRDFNGPVYTGARIDEIPNHVVYPIERIEEKFSAYFLTSSISLMLALAIDTIEEIRAARAIQRNSKFVPQPGAQQNAFNPLPNFVDESELGKPDDDDVIGLWGIDMSAGDEYAYQRPGAQFFILEAMRRGIGVYLPPESEVMRPMPVYGISEWDHNYIKLTTRSRELNAKITNMTEQMNSAQKDLHGAQGEMLALNYFVSTWTCPYGMMAGLVMRQTPGTGMGSGITQIDSRPVERMELGAPAAPEHAEVLDAMSGAATALLDTAAGESILAKPAAADSELLKVLKEHCIDGDAGTYPAETLRIALSHRNMLAAEANQRDAEYKATLEKQARRLKAAQDRLRDYRSAFTASSTGLFTWPYGASPKKKRKR